MIIQNFRELATNFRKKTALKILITGLDAAFPEKSIKKIIKSNKIITQKKSFVLSAFENIFLISYGKAADSMTKTINSILKIKAGIIVIPEASDSLIKSKKFKVIHSGHPIPNQKSVMAAKSIMHLLESVKKKDFVIFLVSGGGSSLISLPRGITLTEKKNVTNQLLKCGATIQEFNCVRKHLSKIKGGMMVANLQCDGVALVMSDVHDNDLSSISSGCTYFDRTTFLDAKKIITKYNLSHKIPKNLLKRFNAGALGKIKETPKRSKITNQIISTNNDCLKEMANKAKQLGFGTKIFIISGNIELASKKLVKLIPKKKNSCVIFGGETTVKVIGNGKGGRNQELVLRILQKLQNSCDDVVFASLGTDGIDGNTEHAGAIIENFPISSQKISKYLKNNDSNSFFKKYGGLIKTGYTHTNLMDIGIILR